MAVYCNGCPECNNAGKVGWLPRWRWLIYLIVIDGQLSPHWFVRKCPECRGNPHYYAIRGHRPPTPMGIGIPPKPEPPPIVILREGQDPRPSRPKHPPFVLTQRTY